jgi:hypothetical protein
MEDYRLIMHIELCLSHAKSGSPDLVEKAYSGKPERPDIALDPEALSCLQWYP